MWNRQRLALGLLAAMGLLLVGAGRQPPRLSVELSVGGESLEGFPTLRSCQLWVEVRALGPVSGEADPGYVDAAREWGLACHPVPWEVTSLVARGEDAPLRAGWTYEVTVKEATGTHVEEVTVDRRGARVRVELGWYPVEGDPARLDTSARHASEPATRPNVTQRLMADRGVAAPEVPILVGPVGLEEGATLSIAGEEPSDFLSKFAWFRASTPVLALELGSSDNAAAPTEPLQLPPSLRDYPGKALAVRLQQPGDSPDSAVPYALCRSVVGAMANTSGGARHVLMTSAGAVRGIRRADGDWFLMPVGGGAFRCAFGERLGN